MRFKTKRQRGFAWIIALFGVYGIILIWAGWYASGIAPSLMSRNYQSIQYASQMESALVGIFLDAVNGKEPSPADIRQFDENLTRAKSNITEKHEPDILQSLTNNWNEFREKPVTPNVETFQKVAREIKSLTAVNETAMLAFQEKAVSLRYTLILGGAMGLFLMLLYAIQIALAEPDARGDRS